MGVSFFAVIVIVLNLGMWIVFHARFKKLFTADDIIASYKQELNKMLSDIDRHTARDVSTIENVSKELKAVIAEADRHVAVAKTELERQEKSKVFQHKLAAKTAQQKPPKVPVAQQRALNSYLRTPQSEEAFDVTPAGKQQLGEQGSLFDEVPAQAEALPPQTFTMAQDGSPYAPVPVIAPEVSFVDDPVRAKKNFGEQVRELSMRGESVDEIARTLARSTTEVEFALAMGV